MTVRPDSLMEALRRPKESPEERRARNREREKAMAVVLAMLGFFSFGTVALVSSLVKAFR